MTYATMQLTNSSPSLVLEDAIAWTAAGALSGPMLSGFVAGALCGAGGYLIGSGLQWVVSQICKSNSSFSTAVISTISAVLRIFSVMAMVFVLVPIGFNATLEAFIFSAVAYTIATILRPVIPNVSF